MGIACLGEAGEVQCGAGAEHLHTGGCSTHSGIGGGGGRQAATHHHHHL